MPQPICDADIDVGRAEPPVRDVVARIESALERVERPFQIAVPGQGLPLGRNVPAQRLVGDRSLDRAGAEKEPAVVGPAFARMGRRREPCLGKDVGEIGADRGGLGDDVSPCLIAGTFPIGFIARYSGPFIEWPNSMILVV